MGRLGLSHPLDPALLIWTSGIVVQRSLLDDLDIILSNVYPDSFVSSEHPAVDCEDHRCRSTPAVFLRNDPNRALRDVVAREETTTEIMHRHDAIAPKEVPHERPLSSCRLQPDIRSVALTKIQSHSYLPRTMHTDGGHPQPREGVCAGQRHQPATPHAFRHRDLRISRSQVRILPGAQSPRSARRAW